MSRLVFIYSSPALQLPFDAWQQVFICSNPHARTHYYCAFRRIVPHPKPRGA